MWRACGKVQKSSGGGLAFINVMEEMMDICDHEEYQLVVVIARKIWFMRNTMVHGSDLLILTKLFVRL